MWHRYSWSLSKSTSRTLFWDNWSCWWGFLYGNACFCPEEKYLHFITWSGPDKKDHSCWGRFIWLCFVLWCIFPGSLWLWQCSQHGEVGEDWWSHCHDSANTILWSQAWAVGADGFRQWLLFCGRACQDALLQWLWWWCLCSYSEEEIWDWVYGCCWWWYSACSTYPSSCREYEKWKRWVVQQLVWGLWCISRDNQQLGTRLSLGKVARAYWKLVTSWR